MDSVPLRIGDADRDRTVERLRTALAEGRLTTEEFEDRMGKALQAHYQSDLDELLLDLPAPSAPVPGPGGTVEVKKTGELSRGRVTWGVVNAVIWPATIITLFATSWNYWWLLFIPCMLMPALAGVLGVDHHHDHHQHDHHRRRLDR